jgi:hypothetical protein
MIDPIVETLGPFLIPVLIFGLGLGVAGAATGGHAEPRVGQYARNHHLALTRGRTPLTKLDAGQHEVHT